MSERWRDHYDSWKHDVSPADFVNEDGEEVDLEEEAARAEDAAVERTERRREDMEFDLDSWKE